MGFREIHPERADQLLRDAYARERGRCFWCGKRVRLHWRGKKDRGEAPKDGATMDHIIPKSDGGKYKIENIVCACSECNQKRRNMPAEIYAKKMFAST